jgi:quercetin dioxygenase-like cupin family protein
VYRMLAPGEQTGGVFTLVEVKVPPGGGPPLHIHHREDEAFFVLEGEMAFTLGDRRIVARPGAFVQGPRGLPHRFKNESSAPARLLVYVTPPGIENFFQEFAEPVASFASPPVPPTPAMIERLMAAAPQYGIEILPPPH